MNDLIILLILLVLSGFFSGSETALIALSMGRAEALRREGRRGAAALSRLKSNPSRMLITILIGNNVVNIGASAMATVIATQRLGHLGPGIAVGVLTVLILIFGEITPKSLATRYAETISLVVAPIMIAITRALFPLVWIFEQFTTWIHRRTGAGADPTVTENELISMVEQGAVEGTIESGERELIERVFEFGDLTVEDVMTPLRQVFSLQAGRSVADALMDVSEGSYTRIPLYEERPDDVSKVLYLRDLLDAIAEGKSESTLRAIAHEALFVPYNQPIDELIVTLRRKKRHLAVVVDEHGSMLGVVTLEDILEELVGEIYDESDQEPEAIKELPDGGIVVAGSDELRIVEDYFDIEIPGKPTDTVSYWILDHVERIPEVEEQFVIDGLDVCVSDASSRRIHQVVIKRAASREETEERSATETED